MFTFQVLYLLFNRYLTLIATKKTNKKQKHINNCELKSEI